MSRMRIFAVALVASLFAAATANAALVTSGNPATFAFDTSGLGGSFTITSGGYSCNASCPEGATDTAALADGASILFNFGSTAGASDLGSATYTNNFGFDIDNVSGGIFGAGVPISGPLTTLFVTMVFVDDEFGVDSLQIGTGQTNLTGRLLVPDVPLPAAAPLFLSALVGAGFLNRKRKKAAA